MNGCESTISADQQKELCNNLCLQVVSKLVDTTRGDLFLESLIPEIMTRVDVKTQEARDEVTRVVIERLVGKKCSAKTLAKLEESIGSVVNDLLMSTTDREMRFILRDAIRKKFHKEIYAIANECVLASLGATFCHDNNVMNVVIQVNTDGRDDEAVE